MIGFLEAHENPIFVDFCASAHGCPKQVLEKIHSKEHQLVTFLASVGLLGVCSGFLSLCFFGDTVCVCVCACYLFGGDIFFVLERVGGMTSLSLELFFLCLLFSVSILLFYQEWPFPPGKWAFWENTNKGLMFLLFVVAAVSFVLYVAVVVDVLFLRGGGVTLCGCCLWFLILLLILAIVVFIFQKEEEHFILVFACVCYIWSLLLLFSFVERKAATDPKGGIIHWTQKRLKRDFFPFCKGDSKVTKKWLESDILTPKVTQKGLLGLKQSLFWSLLSLFTKGEKRLFWEGVPNWPSSCGNNTRFRSCAVTSYLCRQPSCETVHCLPKCGSGDPTKAMIVHMWHCGRVLRLFGICHFLQTLRFLGDIWASGRSGLWWFLGSFLAFLCLEVMDICWRRANTPDPTSANVSRYKWEVCRNINCWCMHCFLPRGGHTFAKESGWKWELVFFESN